MTVLFFDNQELVLAMMATALIASGTSKLVCKKPIYEALAENLLAMMSDAKSRQNKQGGF